VTEGASTETRHGGDDLPRGHAPQSAHSALQLTVAVIVGVVIALVTLVTTANEYAPLAGWDAAAVVYLVWVWVTTHGADAERTAELAVPQEPSRGSADLLVLASAVASLIAVVVVLTGAKHAGDGGKALHAVAAVVSVVVSWTLVHVVHTLSYARLYYSGGDGGIDFNMAEPPRYSDFAYLAFTIGMTFQVSDTALQNSAIRAVALRHALLSYLFGAVIIATSINLIVGLSG